MNRKSIVLTVFILALASAGSYFGLRWWNHGRFVESTDNAYVEADITAIAPKIAGYIQRVPVADNAAVKAGDVLIELDAADYRAKLAQAQATLAAKRTTLATFDAQMQRQSAAINEADAQVNAARADMTRSEEDLRRYNALAASSFASTQKLESAQADQRRSKAALERAAAGRSVEKNTVDVLRANRAEAEAQVKVAEAEVATAQLDVDNAVIRAPVDGVIGNRTAQMGQYVRPGTQLMVLVPTASIHVTANFKETQLGRMQPGQTATLKLDAFPDRPLTAKIESFAPASGSKFSLLPPENATGNFTKIVQRVPVRIEISNPAAVPLLVPGMSVVVDVDTRSEATPKVAANGK